MYPSSSDTADRKRGHRFFRRSVACEVLPTFTGSAMSPIAYRYRLGRCSCIDRTRRSKCCEGPRGSIAAGRLCPTGDLQSGGQPVGDAGQVVCQPWSTESTTRGQVVGSTQLLSHGWRPLACRPDQDRAPARYRPGSRPGLEASLDETHAFGRHGLVIFPIFF